MITREQVADLQPGDVVELSFDEYPEVITRGPVTLNSGDLRLGSVLVLRWEDGTMPSGHRERTLAVVSRAPRPLYVNHPRTEPVPGDVVGAPDDDSNGWRPTWARSVEGAWIGTHTGRPIAGTMLDRLRLLVDGETGQVVQ